VTIRRSRLNITRGWIEGMSNGLIGLVDYLFKFKLIFNADSYDIAINVDIKVKIY